MESNYKLFCLVLGGHRNNVFSVDIRRTQTVGDLKNMIKEKTKHAFRDVDAHRLMLWDVDLLVDEAFENRLNSLKLDPKQFLSPVTQLFKVFSQQPNEKHLHIVVRPPHTASRLVLSSCGATDSSC
ncbi:uncharacterized protein EDB91DRAFT_83444 [Suillus paluster]|uniref:uncharacterized protein n=1 Tax=Suillus paluster TaxID=48578 RepID=UPI001B874802|nr:uncharacterized protein EDB91DRAFT_83444 [Suillus paluster]KAG1725697.1 hypothetical protein EDB91DRAFT_83444 [Suillus paluster]